MYACLSQTHILVSLHVGAFTLLAIPLSSLERHWTEASRTGDIPPLNIDLEPATELNLHPFDTSGLDIIRINLSEPRKPSTGPWVITIHSFVPAWRICGTDVPEEIFVVGLEKDSNAPLKDRLLSWRVQLSRSSYDQSQRQLPDVASNSSGTWCMTALDMKRVNRPEARRVHACQPESLRLWSGPTFLSTAIQIPNRIRHRRADRKPIPRIRDQQLHPRRAVMLLLCSNLTPQKESASPGNSSRTLWLRNFRLLLDPLSNSRSGRSSTTIWTQVARRHLLRRSILLPRSVNLTSISMIPRAR